MSTDNSKHFTASDKVRDIVIGLSDGLTVPFALAAGLTGAVAASKLVVTAGLAEIVAGSISMGLGGYLAAKNDVEHYHRELALEHKEVLEVPHEEEQEVRDILASYELTAEQSDPIMKTFRNNHTAWVNFMMRNELGLEKPKAGRMLTSPLTIAGAYALGGFVPLAPYFFIADARQAVVPSIILTLFALLLFGFFKGYMTGGKVWRSALEMVIIGGIAAGAAYTLARLIT